MAEKEIFMTTALESLKELFLVKRKREIASTIENSEYDGIENFTFKKFDGMYTIKNINPPTSDDLFYINPSNTIAGYIESTGANYLNLIDGKNKLVRSICNSFYHSVMDDLSEIINALKIYPDHELIIDISDVENGIKSKDPFWDFFNFFLETLDIKKIKYKLVCFKKYDVIYMDNFVFVEFVYETGQKANAVYDFFTERIPEKGTVEPYRNVYVSRKKREEFSSTVEVSESKGMSSNVDMRMDDHDAAEEYFASLGYEIVHSELFPSFGEQLRYFYSVKTLVSISGSGLTNAVFMQPGGTVIEIVTPLFTTVPPPTGPKDITKPFYVQEVHNFYKMLAFYMNHYYVGIQNITRKFEDFKNSVESNQDLKRFIDRNEKINNI